MEECKVALLQAGVKDWTLQICDKKDGQGVWGVFGCSHESSDIFQMRQARMRKQSPSDQISRQMLTKQGRAQRRRLNRSRRRLNKSSSRKRNRRQKKLKIRSTQLSSLLEPQSKMH